jgi:predicted cation transporter
LLFWANSVSAILATPLGGSGVGPSLSARQISGALLGLLISGRMLIPGNVRTLSRRTEDSSNEWALCRAGGAGE